MSQDAATPILYAAVLVAIVAFITARDSSAPTGHREHLGTSNSYLWGGVGKEKGPLQYSNDYYGLIQQIRLMTPTLRP